MGLFTAVKSTSSVGLFFKRQASRLAETVARNGGRAVRVFDLFLIRAAGDRKNGRGKTTIVEVPPALLGGYGGQNGATDYYTPALGVAFGALVDDLARRTMRLDPSTGAYLPFKADDAFVLRLPVGDGRLYTGDLPEWTAYRQALNDTTGAVSLYPSALLVAVCPDLSAGALPAGGRSLFLCRSNGTMLPGELVETTAATFAPLTGHPAVRGDEPVDNPARISGLEFSYSSLGLAAVDNLLAAGPALEWGPLRGWVSAYVGIGGQGAVQFVPYSIADGGEAKPGRFTLSTGAPVSITGATLPSGDAAEGIGAVPAVPLDGYAFPSWVNFYCLPNGRPASGGVWSIPRDINQFMRLWAPRAGYPVTSPEAAIGIVEIRVLLDSSRTVDATGWRLDMGSYSYATKTFRTAAALKILSYAVSVTDGGATYRKLAEFVDERYDTDGALVHQRWQAFGGITARDGTARLVCTRRDIPYVVQPAVADIPGPPTVQGEPARRVLAEGWTYVKAEQIGMALVGADDSLEIDLTGYFPAFGSLAVSAYNTTYGGRLNFADTALTLSGTARIGNGFATPFCRVAPGILLLLVHPVGSYAEEYWPVTFFVIDVDTGTVLLRKPTPILVAYNTRLTLSCVQEGTVGPTGLPVHYGTVMLTLSSPATDIGRTDGTYLIHDLGALTWLCREPSNVAMVYGGNGLCPAELGVSTRMTSFPRN